MVHGWSNRSLAYLLAQDARDAGARWGRGRPTRGLVARIVARWLGHADPAVEAAVCRSLAAMHVRFVRA